MNGADKQRHWQSDETNELYLFNCSQSEETKSILKLLSLSLTFVGNEGESGHATDR